MSNTKAIYQQRIFELTDNELIEDIAALNGSSEDVYILAYKILKSQNILEYDYYKTRMAKIRHLNIVPIGWINSAENKHINQTELEYFMKVLHKYKNRKFFIGSNDLKDVLETIVLFVKIVLNELEEFDIELVNASPILQQRLKWLTSSYEWVNGENPIKH